MFTSKDLLSMSYFTILSNQNNAFELQSKNTEHCWKIVEQQKEWFVLYHKHHIEDNYHFQTSFGTLFDTVLDIVDHDEYQLRGRKPVKNKKQLAGSYFDVLIAQYGLC
jgi:hypothetical protein